MTSNIIYPGDFTDLPEAYQPKGGFGLGLPGRQPIFLEGWAKLTDTLQTDIPVMIKSTKPLSLEGSYPDKALTVPIGGQIDYVGFRLPREAAEGDEPIYGVDLPRNTTLIGTTGENLKVAPTDATAHTVTAPAIASADNAFTPDSQAKASRAHGVVDAASPSLLRTVAGSALEFQISVSNAGNTAAGTGIRLSTTGAIAYIYVWVFYNIPLEVATPINRSLPPMPV